MIAYVLMCNAIVHAHAHACWTTIVDNSAIINDNDYTDHAHNDDYDVNE